MSAGPKGGLTLESLSDDLLEQVADAFARSVTFLFDRGDLLQQACTLAMVGSSTTNRLAQLLFKCLSPHLGEEVEICEASSATKLKALLKAWGLPQSGKKADLWQRIEEQLHDSMDPAPWSCLVSAATRRELSCWSRQRISQSKALKDFMLCKSALNDLSFIEETSGNSFMPAKLYLLSDVKAMASKNFSSGEGLEAAKKAKAERSAAWDAEWAARSQAAATSRKEELYAELVRRGWRVVQVEADLMAGDNPALQQVLSGYKMRLSIQEAADYMERGHFAMKGPCAQYYATYSAELYPKKKKLSSWATKHKVELLTRLALAAWVDRQPNLEAVRRHPEVPRHILQELEGYWDRDFDVARQFEVEEWASLGLRLGPAEDWGPEDHGYMGGMGGY